MARTKRSITEQLAKQATKELKKLKEGKLAIKLKVILAYQNHEAKVVAEIFQISVRNLFIWLKAFQEKGIDGLRERPKGHFRSKLTSEQLKQIKEWIIKGEDKKRENSLDITKVENGN